MVIGKKQNHRDHDLALASLLETARRCNIWLNYDKLQYKKTEVDFFGKTYTTSGWKPAQTKVSAIASMPEPVCQKQVQSFIGMANYVPKFSARLSELAEPVRKLAKKRYHSIRAQSTKKPSAWWKGKLWVPQYWPATTPEKQMILQTDASSKAWVHAYYRRENQYTFQVMPTLKLKRHM